MKPTHKPDKRQPYYAQNGAVWKHPIHTRNEDGTTSITIGFRVCTMSEMVGPDAAETVAVLMNAGHLATLADDEHVSDR